MGYVVIDTGSGEVLDSSEDKTTDDRDKPDSYRAPSPALQLELVIPSKPKNNNDKFPFIHQFSALFNTTSGDHLHRTH